MSNVAAMQVVAPVVLVVAVLAAAAASSAAAPGADQCLPLVSPSVPMTWPLPTPSQVANLSVAWAPATEAEVAALSVGARCDLVQHLVGPDPAAWAAPFDPDVPAILTNVTDNRAFAALCRKDALLTRYGDSVVVLSTANTFSYVKVRKTLRDYIHRHMGPAQPYAPAEHVLYHFGDNDHEGWRDLLDQYVRPPLLDAAVHGSVSFGLGGSGSGVPFHTHGPVFAEVVHGRKRWFLYPPDARPQFSPVATSYAWLLDVLPTLPPDARPLECEVGPGQAVYLPHGWWHATLNVGQAVFLSVFV